MAPRTLIRPRTAAAPASETAADDKGFNDLAHGIMQRKGRVTQVRDISNDAIYHDLRARVRIDRGNLHVAAEEQPQLFFEVCEQHTNALSLRDQARDAQSRTDAGLAHRLRAKLQAEGGKYTEAVINDNVMQDSEHILVADKYSAAKQEADRWGILRDAFEQRAKMIRELVSMYATGYWTNAGAAKTNGMARDAMASEARERLEAGRAERRGTGGM